MSSRKDNWIEGVLSSADRKNELPFSNALLDRLKKIPAEVNVGSLIIPMRSVYLAAAGFALLIAVNLFATKGSQQKESTEKTALYNSYFSYLDQL